MKILMPYIDVSGCKITDPKVGGGTEAFSRLIYQNFDVEVVDIPWNTSLQENKQYVQRITQIAHDTKCDLVLSNNIKSPCLYGIRDIGIPIMHITHTNYGLLTANELLAKMETLGHSIYGVSQFNMDYMHKKSDRLRIPRVNYSGTVRPAYARYDLEVETNPESKVVSVGRANSYKAPFSIHRFFGKSKYVPTVITSVGVDNNSVKYYERNKELPHLLNLSHDQVMEHMRTATASVITCAIETYGIAALESLSVGTPILIKTHEHLTHASTEIPASPDHFRTFYKEDPVPLIEQLAKTDRLAIKQETLEKHSKENWVRDMSRAFEQTVDKYKKTGTTSGSLEDFF